MGSLTLDFQKLKKNNKQNNRNMIYNDQKYRITFIDLNVFINGIVMNKYGSRLAELNILKTDNRTYKDLKMVFMHTLLNELIKFIDRESGIISNNKWLYHNEKDSIFIPEIFGFSEDEHRAFLRGIKARLDRHLPLPIIYAQKSFTEFVHGVSNDVGEDLETFLHPKKVVSIREQSKKYEEFGLFYLSNKIKEISVKSSIN